MLSVPYYMGFLIKITKNKKEELDLFLDVIINNIIEGKILAFPTNSVYGLGGDPTDLEIANRLYNLKFRDPSKGFLLLLSDYDEAMKIADFDKNAQKLAKEFWPGQLTLILKKKQPNIIPSEVSGNENTIGLRVPENEIILNILKELKKRGHFGGIIGTSANYSGEKPSITGQEIEKKFLTPIDLIIDSGKTVSKIPTTIVDCTKEDINILRQGKITEEEINEILSK
ncbi:MAG: threonylcarbamoyl-AMP synthase [Candidatus Lokiarchaeota archaeon]|nr:threonylcarbamoyl-AMP synthase [Candidatus Lokiarchaeota archaeon]